MHIGLFCLCRILVLSYELQNVSIELIIEIICLRSLLYGACAAYLFHYHVEQAPSPVQRGQGSRAREPWNGCIVEQTVQTDKATQETEP